MGFTSFFTRTACILILLIWGTTPVYSNASEPDTLGLHILDELVIQARQWDKNDLELPVSVRRISRDVLSRHRDVSVSDLLERTSFVGIRSYGPGNMSQVYQRGMSTRQTRIYWEEMPLNHPMHGGLDMSAIPASFITGLTVSSGNPASLTGHGAGAIGGLISMNSAAPIEKGFVSQSIGSYGHRQSRAGAFLNQGNWYTGVQFQRTEEENDFTYHDMIRGVERKRENNALNAFSGMGQAGYVSGSWRIRSVFWINHIQNDLPGPVSAPVFSRQDDHSIRWILQTGYTLSRRSEAALSGGWYRYDLDYRDNRTMGWERSRTDLLMLQPSLRHEWNQKHQSYVVLHAARQFIKSDNYSEKPDPSYLSLRWNHSWHMTENFTWYPSAEVDYFQEYGGFIHPSLAATFTPRSDNVVFRAAISHTRNTPSFNDRFWVPGGNPDVKPEKVLSYEAGVSSHMVPSKNRNRIELEVSATAFRQHFDQGIRWRPGDDGRFSAVNLDEMLSYGVEFSVDGGLQLNRARMTFSYLLTYTNVSIRRERFAGDQSVGKQLFYVPKWQHRGQTSLHFEDYLWIQFSAGYTGERYTTFDHSGIRDPLDSFVHMDLDVGSRYHIKKMRVDAKAGIKNLGGSNHESILWYPMAPRYYRVSLTLSWL
ncbi:TonB-dependent receptor [Balneolaceae bacterium ANBcel3]|nr:TonB-dependent receptor [Balneolaceae bacterium ANBcel3]